MVRAPPSDAYLLSRDLREGFQDVVRSDARNAVQGLCLPGARIEHDHGRVPGTLNFFVRVLKYCMPPQRPRNSTGHTSRRGWKPPPGHPPAWAPSFSVQGPPGLPGSQDISLLPDDEGQVVGDVVEGFRVDRVIHENHLRLPHGFPGALQDLRLGGAARGAEPVGDEVDLRAAFLIPKERDLTGRPAANASGFLRPIAVIPIPARNASRINIVLPASRFITRFLSPP